MKNIISSVSILCLAASLLVPAAYSNTGDRSAIHGSLYAYSEDDVPEVFFFPKEKARWDGSRITIREWYMLTDLQKQKFLSEYMNEMGKQCNSAIDVMGLDYLRALNIFSYYATEKSSNEPLTKVVDTLLVGQGKLAADQMLGKK